MSNKQTGLLLAVDAVALAGAGIISYTVNKLAKLIICEGIEK